MIVITIREGAVHEALGLPNAPCRRGVGPTESGNAFSLWLFEDILTETPLSRRANGLLCGTNNNTNIYYREILTRLNSRQVETIEERLVYLFNQVNPPPRGSTAEWSKECEARGFLLGHIFVIGRQRIDLIFAVFCHVYIA